MKLNTPGVARALRTMLKIKEPILRRAFARTWAKQRGIVSLDIIYEAIKAGKFTAATRTQLQALYVDLVNATIVPQWEAALGSSSKFMTAQLKASIGVDTPLDIQSTITQDWIRRRGTALAVNLTNNQHDALKKMLSLAAENGMTQNAAAKHIQHAVSITPRQAEWVNNHYRARIADGANATQAKLSSKRYAKRLHVMRAKRIARTELSNAYNEGAVGHMRQLLSTDLLGEEMEKESYAALDERVCPICGDLHGERVGINEQFSGGFDRPTFHPDCRCTLIFHLK